jgi:uncharacterized membrane protein
VPKRKKTESHPIKPADKFSPKFQSAVGTGIVLIALLYLVASFFPGWGMWGLDHLAYYPLWARLLWIALPLLFLNQRVSEQVFTLWQGFWKAIIKVPSVIGVVSAIVSGIIFWLLRYRTDMYGDTRTILFHFSDKPANWEWFKYALRPDHFDEIERFSHNLVAQLVGIDLKTCYIATSILAGMIFVFAVIRYLGKEKTTSELALLIGGLLILNGGTALFLGDIENYTWIYLFIVLFFLSSLKFLEGEGNLWLPTIFLLAAAMLHKQSAVLFPALVLLFVIKRARTKTNLQAWLTLRNLALFAFVPTLVLGTLLYFFYFHSAVQHYELGITKETMFLPIIPSVTEYHYTMYHPTHILDVVNETVLVTSAGTILLLILSLLQLRKISWNHPQILFTLVGVFYYGLFTFTVRPALALPRDWNLMACFGLTVVFFVLTLFRQLQITSTATRHIAPGIIALSLLSSSILGVHGSSTMSSRRLEEIGNWTYHSYYYGAHYTISVAERMIEDPMQQIYAREKMIRRLTPYSFSGDRELANLYGFLGDLQSSMGMNQAALESYMAGLQIVPESVDLVEKTGIAYLNLGEYDKAREMVNYLKPYVPDNPTVLQLQGFLALVLDKDTTTTVQSWLRLLNLYPDHPVVEWVQKICEQRGIKLQNYSEK